MSVFLIHPFEYLRGLRLFLIATPNNQRKTISLGEPNAVEPFQCHAQRLIRKHCMMEKDFCGIKVPRLARSCHMILAAYRPPLLSEKNQCSTDPIDNGPQCGQCLSIFVEIFIRPSFIATTLWMTDQRNAFYFFYFSFFHFFKIWFPVLQLRAKWYSIKGKWKGGFIPSLTWNQFFESPLLSNPFPSLLCQSCKEGSNHQRARSKNNWSSFLKNKLNGVYCFLLWGCPPSYVPSNLWRPLVVSHS